MHHDASTVLLALIAQGSARALQARGTASYDIEVPSTAAVVYDWDSLYSQAALYPDSTLDLKYGGWVIEVDDSIVLAIDDSFVQELSDAATAQDDDEGECENTEEGDADEVSAQRCSHPKCFNTANCRTYTDCHVCTRQSYLTGVGWCI
ncbi:uncharacterized protein F5Z01DRAFT_488571 [Emericellopsis atlantica]|uniref:Uncharacterized protein n=1 Tax=Emericellopsis atlantica TaxID=2614577 RepID=A0A9P7ZRK0_9HYPO|nr:uncharacterized protein F5Z01DRAFT_488571 [Emericellopsis atlantica]KAG9256796.1 hypothetical protein F5Z01DRAFT_488571 [Emericellopsis atlantica]